MSDDDAPESVQGGLDRASLPRVREPRTTRYMRRQRGHRARAWKGARHQALLAPHISHDYKIVKAVSLPWWTRAGYPMKVKFEPELDWSILERTKARRLLTLAEAAPLSGRSHRALREMAQRGTFPAVLRRNLRTPPAYYMALETALWLRDYPKNRRVDRVATDRYRRRDAILNLESE